MPFHITMPQDDNDLFEIQLGLFPILGNMALHAEDSVRDVDLLWEILSILRLYQKS